MKTTVCAVICAGGKGARAGFSKNKLLIPIDGQPVLVKTLSAFAFSAIDEIVVSVSKEDYAEIAELCKAFANAKVVVGGQTRGESVYNALQAVQSEIVLIHDGARPFITQECIENCIQSVKAYGSGICAVPATDTVAVSKDGYITEVPDRSTLSIIQTPQGFYKENISYAYARALESGRTDYTDDSSLFAIYCGKPRLCEGERENTKLTYAEDFQTAFARV